MHVKNNNRSPRKKTEGLVLPFPPTPWLVEEVRWHKKEPLPYIALWYTRLRALPQWTRRRFQRRVMRSLAGVALLFALDQGAGLAAVRVTTTAPGVAADGKCSLAEALGNFQNIWPLVSEDCPYDPEEVKVIILPPNSTFAFSGTIFIATDTGALTIQGNGSTIRGISFVTLDAGIALQDLTLSGGGQIYSTTYSSVNHCTLDGVSIQAFDGGFDISDSIITNNSGTGVTISYTIVSITRSVLSNNRGGGLLVETDLQGSITDSIISGNTAGQGGGAWVYAVRYFLIDRTLIVGNTAVQGGGVYAVSGAVITNSTISGNTATDSGGGIGVDSSPMTLEQSTVTDNRARNAGGGIWLGPSSGPLNSGRSLIAGNTAPVGPELANFAFGSSGEPLVGSDHTLYGSTGNPGVVGFTPGPTDLVPSVPLSSILNPTLADNGGPTHTHALVSGSPAINAAGRGCPPPETDQRGVSRPKGAACDIGAVEVALAVECAPDISKHLRVQAGGWHRDSRTGRYVQQLTLTNLSRMASAGPVSLALDHLSQTASLYTPSGTTACTTPTSPFVNLAVGADKVLSPGESVQTVLEFTNPTNARITYIPRVLAGPRDR